MPWFLFLLWFFFGREWLAGNGEDDELPRNKDQEKGGDYSPAALYTCWMWATTLIPSSSQVKCAFLNTSQGLGKQNLFFLALFIFK